MDNVRSFDEFLERKFPESRRKAYYLMAIHEHLPRIPKADLRSMGWTKARELAKVARRERQGFDCAPWVHKADVKDLVEEGRHRLGTEAGAYRLHDPGMFIANVALAPGATHGGTSSGSTRTSQYCSDR